MKMKIILDLMYLSTKERSLISRTRIKNLILKEKLKLNNIIY